MDNDDYRRGKLTCHKKFGEATAILAGDALLALAFEAIAQGRRPAIESRLIKEFARSIGSLGIAGGQCVDIEYEGKQKDKKVLSYINSKKTGELIRASLKMGAIVSGAADKKIRQLEKFGACIGEAFQIVDDVLDNGSSARVLGRAAAVKKAGLLTKEAKTALAIFKNKSDTLKKIADFLSERKL
jgi:geranylgeranyl diphosphate synthase type II